MTHNYLLQLHYRADAKKIKHIFKLAGKIVNLECNAAVIGRGYYCVIEYEHPVEAVQAISLFDQQLLYDRPMSVRLDRLLNRYPAGIKLPIGITDIGVGLGPYGLPLRNVTQNVWYRNNYWQNYYYYGYSNAAAYNNINDMNMKMNFNRNATSHPMPITPFMQPSVPIYFDNMMGGGILI